MEKFKMAAVFQEDHEGKCIFALNLSLFIPDEYFYCQIIHNWTHRNEIYLLNICSISLKITTMVVIKNIYIFSTKIEH